MDTHPFAVVPLQGPIQLAVHSQATAHQCGVVYHLDIDEGKAALIRVLAEGVGLSLDVFVEAVMNQDLDTEPVPIPPKHLARSRRTATRAVHGLPASKRRRLDEAARAQGHRDAVTMLVSAWEQEEAALWVASPAGGKRCWIPRAVWNRVEEWLQVYRYEVTSDPLDEPGFMESLLGDGAERFWMVANALPDAEFWARYPQLIPPAVRLQPAPEHAALLPLAA